MTCVFLHVLRQHRRSGGDPSTPVTRMAKRNKPFVGLEDLVCTTQILIRCSFEPATTYLAVRPSYSWAADEPLSGFSSSAARSSISVSGAAVWNETTIQSVSFIIGR